MVSFYLQVASAVPKLIVKFGSGLTPERVESPIGGGVAVAPVGGGPGVATGGATPENTAYPPAHHHSADHQDQYQYHHRYRKTT